MHRPLPQGKGMRLDAFLSMALPDASRAKVQASIKEGLVFVNGRMQPKASAALRAGDVVSCTLLPPVPLEVSMDATHANT